jgi:hypothetical protein
VAVALREALEPAVVARRREHLRVKVVRHPKGPPPVRVAAPPLRRRPDLPNTR